MAVGAELNDYMQGEADAISSVVAFVSRLRGEAMTAWAQTDPELLATRAYWRGKHRTCVDILIGLGVDE